MRMVPCLSEAAGIVGTEDATARLTGTNPCVVVGIFGARRASPDPVPDHIGIEEAIIQRNPGDRCTELQALEDNLGLEFPGKPATALAGLVTLRSLMVSVH